MSLPRLSAFVPLVLALFAGCDAAPPSMTSGVGDMQLAVSMAVPGDVSRVTVTVSGADMASRVNDLTLTSGAWSGVLTGLPAGTGRTFLAQAFTSSNVLRYEGRVENVTVTADTTGLVSIVLQDVSPPPPYTNEAPVIDSLTASATTVAPGGSVTLTASAHDPNAGDSVSYSWTASAGSFASTTQSSTTWTAPSSPGQVTLFLSLADTRGATSQVILKVRVAVATGSEEVKVSFNTAPQVLSMRVLQSFLEVNETTGVFVTATDADGDPLSYQWSATCAGAFSPVNSPGTRFAPSALPSTEACNNCQLSVLVSDGRGGQSTGSIAVCVSRGAVWSTPAGWVPAPP